VLLVEELGELATALRARMGLLMSEEDEPEKTVRLELADCLIYILHMANQTGINLTSALRKKERINAAKKWYSP
jgi:NTP pyrophosphatase (non-canonical NTP hydrolase)